MQRPFPLPQEDYSKESASRLGGGDKHTSTYDLVEQIQYLYVWVVKTRDLPPKDATGSYDPYVEVKLGNYKGTTQHFEKKNNHEWNQVFAFSKDRIQASLVEVIVKDKDLVKNDDFIGMVIFDLNEVPKRVPPDCPLSPSWFRLEDRTCDKVKGELMLAVWMGTQADEAFSKSWHFDATTGEDSSSLPLRRLQISDNAKGFVELLSQLSPSTPMSDADFGARFADLAALGDDHVVVVAEDPRIGRIVATGSIFIERKFLRGGGKVGHIEDVVVDANSRGHNLGHRVMRYLTEHAKAAGCYKVILDCTPDLHLFYSKCGFEEKNIQMALYF